MKKFSLLLLLTIVCSNAYSQPKTDYYFGIGYNFNSSFKEPLDYLVQRYNETRPSLLTKTKMETPSNMSGMSFSFGVFYSKILFDMEYAYKYSSTMIAEAASGDITQKREVKIFGKSLNLGINYVLGERNFYFMPGFSFDFNFMPVESRIYNVNNTEPPSYENISEAGGGSFSNSVFMFTPNIHFDYQMSGNLFISLKPYYSFSLGELDYSYLNEQINPNTYQNDPADKTSSNISYFGILFKIKYQFIN